MDMAGTRSPSTSQSASIVYVHVIQTHNAADPIEICSQTILQLMSEGKRESIALVVAFARLDKELSRVEMSGDCGASAVVALVHHRNDGKWLWVANCGNARAILIRNEGVAVQLSEDHKPTVPNEAKKLKGDVAVIDGKIGGVLSVSRAFGHFSLKEHITVEPACAKTELSPYDSALILASQGLWNVCDNTEVERIIKGQPTAQAMADLLVRQALVRGSTDNVSVVVVLLDDPSDPKPPAPMGPAIRPLPAGWEQQFDDENVPFFIDHVAEKTTYVNPIEAKQRPLPSGWEQRTSRGAAVFVNHRNKVTTFMVLTPSLLSSASSWH
jgi:serine/threonine protein phosphatase PrpC